MDTTLCANQAVPTRVMAHATHRTSAQGKGACPQHRRIEWWNDLDVELARADTCTHEIAHGIERGARNLWLHQLSVLLVACCRGSVWGSTVSERQRFGNVNMFVERATSVLFSATWPIRYRREAQPRMKVVLLTRVDRYRHPGDSTRD